MNPLLATGLLNIGNNIVSGIFGTSTSAATKADSSDFSSLLSKETAEDRLLRIQQEIEQLNTALENDMQTYQFMQDAPEGTTLSLNVNDAGQYELTRSDGKTMTLDSGSITEAIAKRIDELKVEEQTLTSQTELLNQPTRNWKIA
jgi:hypothetical protein